MIREELDIHIIITNREPGMEFRVVDHSSGKPDVIAYNTLGDALTQIPVK